MLAGQSDASGLLLKLVEDVESADVWREGSHTGLPHSTRADSLCPLICQVGAGDLDGFQADTEEEEEEDGDCVMMDISGVAGENGPSPHADWRSRGRVCSLSCIVGVGLKDPERHWAEWAVGSGPGPRGSDLV